MKKFALYIIASVLLMAVAQGCIKNDIPYPRIQANITYIQAEGQDKAALIDSVNRKVTIFMPEEANIHSVRIDTFALSPNTTISQGNLLEPIDLSSPYNVTLTMYQDYEWTIEGKQDIDRYFIIDGQIGTSVIDVPAHRVLATVSDNVPLNAIYVVKCKLGSSTATAKPDIKGKTVDFTRPVVINVENYGYIEQWTIYVTQTESTVSTVRVDAWTKVAWVYGEAQADKKNYVQYRIKGDTEWLDAPDDWIKHDGGDFCARLIGLDPETTYEARAVSDNEYAQTIEFTTGADLQLPNSNFDHWWLDGKVWDPWEKGGTPYWDTGNKGAATLGQSNSTPTDDTVTGEGQAAKLETKFIGIGIIGKLGAGNIFVGTYVRTDGTNGILSFGREFHQRPTKLTGYWKYKTAPISSASSGFEYMKGQPDTCTVWIALIDSQEPFEVRTNPNNRQLFDPAGDYVVAYGRIQSGDNIDAYAPFEVPLEYKSTSRTPKYIIVTASASKYGDYFTGGNGAVLYVDDFKLEYDY